MSKIYQTLYYGPFSSSYENGVSSRYLLDKLAGNLKYNIYPLWLSDTNIDTEHYGHLRQELNDIDLCVQHCPPEYLTIPQLACKNIYIPINHNYCYINKFEYFDTILVDDNQYYNILTKNYKLKNIKKFKYSEPIDNLQTFEFDILNSTKKFYYIGNYTNNKNIIQKIISSFYIASLDISDVSLILFLNDTENNRSELEEYISFIRSELKIQHSLQKHRIYFHNFSSSELCSAHKSGNILINTYDFVYSNIHQHIAEYYRNQVISTEDLITIDIPDNKSIARYSNSSMTKTSIVTNSLIAAIKQKYQNLLDIEYKNKYYYIHNKNINDIIC